MSLKQDNLAASQKPHDPNYDVLAVSESKRLLQAVGADPAKALLRDVITIILNTGLRAGELASLRVEDVDLEKHTLTLVPSKTVDRRHVPFNEDVAKVLSERISANAGSKLVFGETACARIESASRLLTKIGKRVIGRRVCIQTLRHTFATNMLQAGMDVAVLALICGWRCSSSPFKRLFPVQRPEVQKAYREALDKARKEN